MEKRDARKLSADAQQELRIRAVKMVKTGMSMTRLAVSSILEVSSKQVGSWVKRYEQGGYQALQSKQKGRPEGSGQQLTSEQEKEIQKLITDKMPDQLKLKFALWSREAVRKLIQDRYGITFVLQHISNLLKRWGFTPQRPIKRAYEQMPAAAQKWMEETYPSIKEKASNENATIYWGDETAVKPEAHVRRSYAPKGKTPTVRQPAKRFHSSVISAINNQGKMVWMALKNAMNADLFITFLKRLIHGKKRKVILIVDNLRAHHSKKVKAWLSENTERIEVYYLPSYSPELNPDEYLNQTLKKEVSREGVAKVETELKKQVRRAMYSLQKQASKIKNLFKHPKAKYAAA